MNVLILLISICVVIISVKLFSSACGSMSPLKLNTVSYVFYFQIVTSAIVASVLMAIGALDYHSDLDLVSNSTKIEAWVWTMYSLVAMPLAMIGLNKFLGINMKEVFHKYLKAPIEEEGTNISNELIIILLTGFSLIILLYVLIMTDRVPLFTLLFEGDSAQANIDRITSKRNFGGIGYIKNLGGIIMVPIITYYSYIILRQKKSIFYFVFFAINLMIGLLMVSHDVQKAPIAFFILGFAVVEIYISKGISLRSLGLFVVLPVLLLLVGYSLTTGVSFGSQIFDYHSAFYGRTFLIGYFAFPLSLELFPEVITQSTQAIGIPSFIMENMGVNTVESARLLKEYVHPESIVDGSGNLYSGWYMGEAWANYGYIGLIISPIMVGIVIQVVHVFVVMNKKTAWLLAFYALITVKWLVGAGFSNFFYLKLLLFPLILYYVSNFILKSINRIKINRTLK